ncbi:DUF4350 domain-containing protein [Ornithinimicrobium sp. Y1694]|uniref:DUF4350 domain-containing protein n=1 Tax=Ornithinimicrobium sp. Y1694 TaxID=3418590 RepID=UPI003CF34902
MSTGSVRRWAPWILLALVAAVVSALLASTRAPATPYDPTSAHPTGTRALVEVLRDRGVSVDVVDGTRALTAGDRPPGAGTTVLLQHTAYLGPRSGPDLVGELADVDRLVILVASPQQDPSVLGVPVVAQPGLGSPAAGCTSPTPLVREGDAIASADVFLQPGDASGADVDEGTLTCFGDELGGSGAGALLHLPAAADRPEITLVGFPGALTNGEILKEAHAALGMRLLGGSDRLAWVVPNPADAGNDVPTGLWDVLPRNMTASVVLLAAAVLALALWRGRRLGPVVTEPLPTIVHASQTTRSRGRLYRQAADREHALAALQEGSRHRLRVRLGLPASTPADSLTRAVADATDRPQDEIHRLLTDHHSAAAHDAAFVTTARELRSLEEGLNR